MEVTLITGLSEYFLLAIIDRENIILLSKKGQDTHEGSSNPDANSKR